MRKALSQKCPVGRRARRRPRRGCSSEPDYPMNTTYGCRGSGIASATAGLTAGAAGKRVPADGWLGGFGRWNAGQSHSAGQIDDRPVARTSARKRFPPWKEGLYCLYLTNILAKLLVT